ncbi:putative cobaltochelatase [Herbaspirillum lusitanum]|uniref:Mg-protoporphyrin IX chelatase n=1 Tax=Herbaspirillum lusitanum TaxID=213312 RepID=A0ABW9AAP2_9BURK
MMNSLNPLAQAQADSLAASLAASVAASLAAADATPVFPFSAIVGQPLLKSALLLCAVDPGIGGVLIRGDKGTAKSTAARGLAQVLPAIARVPGCAFNCLPGKPAAACEICHPQQPAAHPAAVPFVTLPLGATEDRVLGTLDLQRALQGAQRAFQPGLLASAHRGILYIDEVNLLADHLVDVLLDVAAMGVNSVQREGLSVTHPARFTLIGTMNLEEGDLRPQLLDRFGLMVEVTAPQDKKVRAEVVRRRIAFEADPPAYAQYWQLEQQALQQRIADAQQRLPQVVLSDAMLDLISHLCCEFEVASLRADIVMHKTARAFAALAGRDQVTPDDIRDAAQLVLPHRRRRKPFEQPGLDQDKLDELMQEQQTQQNQQEQGEAPPPQPPTQNQQNQQEQDTGEGSGEQQPAVQQDDSDAAAGTQVFAAVAPGTVRKISVDSAQQSIAAQTAHAGRRSSVHDVARGSMVRAVPDSNPDRLAVGATLRSAVVRSALNGDLNESGHIEVARTDLHRQVRAGKSANLILFVVDASGSMAAQRRMEAVKGAVLALLTDVYQRRDQVAVIAFRGERAELLLAPTRSVDLAEQGLRELPTGGRTPLPHALALALETLQQAAANDAPPLLVLLSDGKANVACGELGGSDADPWRQTQALAQRIGAQGVPALVLDTEAGYLRLGRAAQLAEAMGAQYLTLEQLSAESLALTVRSQLGK